MRCRCWLVRRALCATARCYLGFCSSLAVLVLCSAVALLLLAQLAACVFSPPVRVVTQYLGHGSGGGRASAARRGSRS